MTKQNKITKKNNDKKKKSAIQTLESKNFFYNFTYNKRNSTLEQESVYKGFTIS
jgi:hypothetical protein